MNGCQPRLPGAASNHRRGHLGAQRPSARAGRHRDRRRCPESISRVGTDGVNPPLLPPARPNQFERVADPESETHQPGGRRRRHRANPRAPCPRAPDFCSRTDEGLAAGYALAFRHEEDSMGHDAAYAAGRLRTVATSARRPGYNGSSDAAGSYPVRAGARSKPTLRRSPPSPINLGMAVNAFVRRPSVAPAPDLDSSPNPGPSDELQDHQADSAILDSCEVEWDCAFSSRPHRHFLEVLVARRPG
jgi:hypothetical protein